MISPIEKLEQELWNTCVIKYAAKDQETLDRWQRDEYAHIKERFLIQPIPSKFDELLEKALAQWQQIEEKVLSSLGMNREQFLTEFENLRKYFLNKGKEWQNTVACMQLSVYGAVRNMKWVNMFSFVLPDTDKEYFTEYRAIGRMVVAIFYLELLYKYDHDYENNNLKIIEARWLLVNE